MSTMGRDADAKSRTRVRLIEPAGVPSFYSRKQNRQGRNPCSQMRSLRSAMLPNGPACSPMTSSLSSPWRCCPRLGCKAATTNGRRGRGPTPTTCSRRSGCNGMKFASKTSAAPPKPSHERPPFILSGIISAALGGTAPSASSNSPRLTSARGRRPYHRAVSRSLLISAVARVFEPGCKADHVPVLEGPQGGGKSTSIGVLFSPWFSDDLAELGTKDAAMQVRAAWGVEISELAAMTRGEIEKVKAFISRSTDIFRPPFGKRVVSVPRQSIFIGSTNSDKYIRDETGGRRFWPIACGSIDIDALDRDRDQLWAEAVQLYYAGVQWWLNDAETVHATAEQEARRVEDAWEPVIEAWDRRQGRHHRRRHTRARAPYRQDPNGRRRIKTALGAA